MSGNNQESVIIEIRAGTGGQESALFANDLFRMYFRYASLKEWKQKILESKPSDLGGLKEVIFELSGPNALSEMQHEGGVHRVQRIPKTEKRGRIHTSTATVAVLEKPKETDIKIRPEEIRVDFYRSSGPGGQYTNKRETAVRITYLPTGLVATSQTERNQLQNKENAMAVLQARVSEQKRHESLAKLDKTRRSQIKWAKRSDKIRTYNFPQDRLTDHRIKKSFHDLEAIMGGRLDKLLKALNKSLQE